MRVFEANSASILRQGRAEMKAAGSTSSEIDRDRKGPPWRGLFYAKRRLSWRRASGRRRMIFGHERRRWPRGGWPKARPKVQSSRDTRGRHLRHAAACQKLLVYAAAFPTSSTSRKALGQVEAKSTGRADRHKAREIARLETAYVGALERRARNIRTAP